MGCATSCTAASSNKCHRLESGHGVQPTSSRISQSKYFHELNSSLDAAFAQLLEIDSSVDPRICDRIKSAFVRATKEWDGQEVILDHLSPYAPAGVQDNNKDPSKRHKPVKLNVDLSGEYLGDAGAWLLQRLLLPKYRIERLSIAGCGIGKHGALHIANRLQYNTIIKYLDISNNPLGSIGVGALLTQLPRAKKLQHFQLTNTNMDTKAAHLLSIALLSDTSIERVNVSNNQIGKEGLDALCMAARACRKLRYMCLVNNPGSTGDSSEHQEILNKLTESRVVVTSTIDFILQSVAENVRKETKTSKFPGNGGMGKSSLDNSMPMSRDLRLPSAGWLRYLRLSKVGEESDALDSPESSMSKDKRHISSDASHSNCSMHHHRRSSTGSQLSCETHPELERRDEFHPRGSGSRACDKRLELQLRDQRTTVEYSSTENIGLRHAMLDYTLTIPDFMGRKGDYLFGVFDGHLGPHCARFTAANLPCILRDELQKAVSVATQDADSRHVHVELSPADSKRDLVTIPTDLCQASLEPSVVEECLRRTFKRLNEYVCAIKIPFGTCALLGYLRDSTLYTVSVGDSIAVLYKRQPMGNGVKSNSLRAERISRTFRPSDPDEHDRITKLKGFVTQNGRLFGLAVSRAVGDIQYQPYLSTEPHIESRNIDYECYVVMGSDGMWDPLSTDEVAEQLESRYSKASPFYLSQSFVNSAIEEGSRDNISVIVAHILPSQQLTPVAAA